MKNFFATLLFGIGCIGLGLDMFMVTLYKIAESRDPDVYDDGSRWFVITFCLAATLISVIFFIGYTDLKGWTTIFIS